jgi:hypothetical protein
VPRANKRFNPTCVRRGVSGNSDVANTHARGLTLALGIEGSMSKCLSFITLSILIVINAGCARSPLTPDLNADSFIFYSIDGRDVLPPKSMNASEKFRGFPVLGKVDIKDMNTRKELNTAFKAGCSEDDRRVAGCFWPRHGVSTTRGGKTTDFVICFECTQYNTFEGDESVLRKITQSPLSTFNAILERSGIELAPSPFEHSK